MLGRDGLDDAVRLDAFCKFIQAPFIKDSSWLVGIGFNVLNANHVDRIYTVSNTFVRGQFADMIGKGSILLGG